MCDVLYMMFVDGFTVALKHNPVRLNNLLSLTPINPY